MENSLEKLKKMLIRHEGLELKPYKCSAGKLSIGVGRNLDDVGITLAEANYMLDGDLVRTIQAATTNFSWFVELSEARQAVIVSMIFNLGLYGFIQFKDTIRAVALRDYALASKLMLDSRWARQVGNRALELSKMMETGEYAQGK